MKLLVYSDLHFTSCSSIIRRTSGKYSDRLNACINTLNFIEDLAYQESCDKIICCGDFFDKATLNSEEISALKEVKFKNDIEHILLLGNHEMQDISNKYNSLNFFAKHNNFKIIDKITTLRYSDVILQFIPYQYELNGALDSILKIEPNSIIFSHNDIKGIQYGKIKSEVGLDLNSIETSQCKLFINGHLHSGTQLGDKSYNIGNVVGLNFSENGFVYDHDIFIIDTEGTDSLKKIPNPYSFYFYKFIANKKNISMILDALKNNAVCSITTSINDYEAVKEKIEKNNKVSYIKYNFIIENKSDQNSQTVQLDSLSFDINTIYEMLSDFCKEKLGESEDLNEEVNAINRGN